MTYSDYRLPRILWPRHYDIDLQASPRRQGFAGNLTIFADLLESTNVMELHARDLAVSHVFVSAKRVKMKGVANQHSDRETVTLVFPKPVPKGKIVIELFFKGTFNASMHGLYIAKDGSERAIVSQCEATDARAIFPCLDEPEFKATLGWTVTTDLGLVVVTNGVLKSSRRSGKQVTHIFKPTRVIPTYLAALAIGKFESTKVKRIAGTPSRVLCGQGKLGQTDFAMAVTQHVLPWFQKYFGQKYNYQKLDQVAVPGFDAGAMENVGAIFYRQNLLLMQPETASWQGQKRIAEVIAHEIAHQWFGNLVTMKWWDDLWLNEAFATWIAYKVVDLWRKDWRLWDDFLESKESALAADALVNTHPIYTEVKSPAQATELFDVITYEKGCAVLRMTENYLGDETFRKGIQSYQKVFKNKNATGADLWQKLDEASGETVGEMMQSWITQPGFPLLSMNVSPGTGGTRLHVKQRRFFANRTEMQKANTQTWTIPVTVVYEAGNGRQEHRLMVRGSDETFLLPVDSPSWVYANANATGFYRTQLADEMLDRLLGNGLGHLAPAERLTLLDDQWALTRNGLSDIQRFMNVLSAFRHEHDHVVLRSVVSRLLYLDQFVVTEKSRSALANYCTWLLGHQLQEMGWERLPDETPAQASRRALIIDALGVVGRQAEVWAQAEERVELEMRDPASIEPNLAGVVVQLGAVRGDVQQYERYVRTFTERKKKKAAPELQSRYLGGLTSFEDPNIIEKVLRLCLDEVVPQEQLRTVLTPLLAKRASQQATWAFLKRHWRTLSLKVGTMGVSRLVEATGSLPVQMREDVAEFFKKNPVEQAQRAMHKALESMDLRRDLLDREQARLSQWLARS